MQTVVRQAHKTYPFTAIVGQEEMKLALLLNVVQGYLREHQLPAAAEVEQELRALDLRGNMEAGDMALEVVAGLPKLAAFKRAYPQLWKA